MTAILFWACAALLLYAHLGYPLLVWLWASLKPREGRPRVPRGGLPELTVLVIAQDEAARIQARIEDLLAQGYPRGRLTIAIASDGSTDATAALARGREAEGVQVLEFAEPRGKPAVLNDLVPYAPGGIVVLADARQRFAPGALQALAGRFDDPTVGAVSGELVLDAAPGGGGGGLYWAYEKFLRKCESRIDSTIGATGAIYALRRELFALLPVDTVLDDVFLPCRVVQQGFRVVFEPAAVAHDRPAPPAAEFRRKVRTLSGNFQLFARERWLLDPRLNRLWLQTVSHKLLRLACPPLLLGALAASALLARQPLYRGALAVQLAFYAAALAGWLLSRRGGRVRLLAAPSQFCLLHAATVAGFVRFARGRAVSTWRTPPARGPRDLRAAPTQQEKEAWW